MKCTLSMTRKGSLVVTSACCSHKGSRFDLVTHLSGTRGFRHPPLPAPGTHTIHLYTYRQNTYILKIKFKNSNPFSK